jgi:hypothetical protein
VAGEDSETAAAAPASTLTMRGAMVFSMPRLVAGQGEGTAKEDG